jgi:multimeric flavodoxin WrbA
MKVTAVNGGPRKDWNTGTLLAHVLEGAASMGAETGMVHLHDLAFRGCSSCFACKTKGNTCAGLCATRDALRPVLEDALMADALILGSPIYFFDVTGAMRSFMERLLFPNITYDDPPVRPRDLAIRCAFLFTLGMDEQTCELFGVPDIFQTTANPLRNLMSGQTHPPVMGPHKGPGGPEIFVSYDTYQFADYSRMQAARFDLAAKTARRAERFPEDCRGAHELGARLAMPE